MTIKAAKMDEPKKAAAVKQAGIKQKIKKQAATNKKEVEQKTTAGHAAPAKEDAPVKRCTVSFLSACVVLVSAALFFAVPMALRGSSNMSTDAAEVVTIKSVSSWADASNDQQCKMHDDNGVRNDFTAVQEAKGFAHNASLDPTASERAGLRVEKEEGEIDMGPNHGTSEHSLHPSSTTHQRACFSAVPPQFLPMLLALTTLPAHAAEPSTALAEPPAVLAVAALAPMLKTNGIDEAEHETVLGCARSVTEHSTTGRRMLIQHQITAYSDDKQRFDMIDTDRDGYIVMDEAPVQSGSEDEWHHTLEAFDANEDGKLDYAEFLTLLAEQRENAKEEQVPHDFDSYETSMATTDTYGPNDYYYESPAYQELLTKRAEEIHAAEASVVVGTTSLSARHEHLGRLFAAADTNNDSKVSLAEYTAAGKGSRFAFVQGGFKEAMDRNGDGVVSESEALHAAAFEFDVIDGDRDGVVSDSELKHILENKGWLRRKDWQVAQTLATDAAMPHLMTAYVETHWGDVPEEDYADEEACEASKAPSQPNAALADDIALFGERESDTLSGEHMNVSAGTRRLKRFRLSKEVQEDLIGTALSVGIKAVTEQLATDFCWIKSYDRGVGIIAGCRSGWEERGAMCYKNCPSGGTRDWYDIEFCGFGCPSGSTNWGLTCRTNGWTKSKSCCYALGICWAKCCGGCPAGHTNTGCFCEPCVTLASILRYIWAFLSPNPTHSPLLYCAHP